MAIHLPASPFAEAPSVHRLIIVRRGAAALYDELCTKFRHDAGTIVIFDRRRTGRIAGRADGGFVEATSARAVFRISFLS